MPERNTSTRMPTIFFGHGNPMNALQDNDWSRGWAAIGQRLPVLMGASGRLFAGKLGLDEERLRAAFDKVRWARPLGFDDYRRQVADASAKGWAVDDGYFSAGILAIAAPVNDRAGTTAYAMSAVTFRGQHTEAETEKLGQALRKAATKVGNILF